MDGDNLIWFLAGIGVGLAVAMLAFLLLSVADRRALARQRRARSESRSEPAMAQQIPAAVRLASPTGTQAAPTSDRKAGRSAPRAVAQHAEPSLPQAADFEPDFGDLAPTNTPGYAQRHEHEPIFDLTDLPQVASPGATAAQEPALETPVPAEAPALPAEIAPDPSPIAAASESAVAEEPAPVSVAGELQRMEGVSPPTIRRPPPPPRPLPASARPKAATAEPIQPKPASRPTPISIAPLKGAQARLSADGSKAPANFRPLLPKTDGASRPARLVQRRPFTEITVPFEGPATLPDTPPVAAPSVTPVPDAASVAPAAAEAPAVSVETPASPAPAQPAPDATPVVSVTAPVADLGSPASPPPSTPDESELDNAAAAAIEKGSNRSTATVTGKVEKPLPKMPPPRLTPDTVEAIFAEAFARGSSGQSDPKP